MPSAKDNAINLYLRGIRDGEPEYAQTHYTGARYKQHSTGVPDGKEGFIAFFRDFVERYPDRDIKIVRALQDGKYVFLHVHQNLNQGAAQWVTTDIFECDADEKLIEHWDVISAYTDDRPHGRTQIDGEVEIKDQDKTDANRQHVKDFIKTCLIDGKSDKMPEYISEQNFIEHNPKSPQSLVDLQALWSAADRKMTYQDIFLTVAEGNFVATQCYAAWEGTPLCHVDLFRLEDGKIVEHWDNTEVVPPEEELTNSGKF